MATQRSTLQRPGRQLDQAFRALAEPSRRDMLDRLAERPLTVSELAAPLNITVAAAVQHIQVLEMSGLVQTHKTGRVRTCSLQASGFEIVEGWLADRRTMWTRRLDRLGTLLDDDEAAAATSQAEGQQPTPGQDAGAP